MSLTLQRLTHFALAALCVALRRARFPSPAAIFSLVVIFERYSFAFLGDDDHHVLASRLFFTRG